MCVKIPRHNAYRTHWVRREELTPDWEPVETPRERLELGEKVVIGSAWGTGECHGHKLLIFKDNVSELHTPVIGAMRVSEWYATMTLVAVSPVGGTLKADRPLTDDVRMDAFVPWTGYHPVEPQGPDNDDRDDLI